MYVHIFIYIFIIRKKDQNHVDQNHGLSRAQKQKTLYQQENRKQNLWTETITEAWMEQGNLENRDHRLNIEQTAEPWNEDKQKSWLNRTNS